MSRSSPGPPAGRASYKFRREFVQGPSYVNFAENVKCLSRDCIVACVDSPAGSPLLRIGELSRRLGVSDHVLRAWESRYGLLQPVRSPGGFRLYSEADEARIRRMQAYLAQGLSAAEAARAALGDAPSTHPPEPAGPAAGSEPFAELRRALDAFDEPTAQAELDRLIAELSLPAVLREVILPYLADLGPPGHSRSEHPKASAARPGPAPDRRTRPKRTNTGRSARLTREQPHAEHP